MSALESCKGVLNARKSAFLPTLIGIALSGGDYTKRSPNRNYRDGSGINGSKAAYDYGCARCRRPVLGYRIY